MILGHRRPSVALIALHTHTHTHKSHREYIVITLDRFPGVRCKQIIVHFWARHEGDRELGRTEQSANNNAEERQRGNIKVAPKERGEEKSGIGKEEDKRKHDTELQTQSEEAERDQKPTWHSV